MLETVSNCNRVAVYISTYLYILYSSNVPAHKIKVLILVAVSYIVHVNITV